MDEDFAPNPVVQDMGLSPGDLLPSEPVPAVEPRRPAGGAPRKRDGDSWQALGVVQALLARAMADDRLGADHWRLLMAHVHLLTCYRRKTDKISMAQISKMIHPNGAPERDQRNDRRRMGELRKWGYVDWDQNIRGKGHVPQRWLKGVEFTHITTAKGGKSEQQKGVESSSKRGSNLPPIPCSSPAYNTQGLSLPEETAASQEDNHHPCLTGTLGCSNNTGGVGAQPDSVLPQRLRKPAFYDAWDRWKRHREQLRKPLTPEAERAFYRDFEEKRASVEEVCAAIENSIRRGYPDIYLAESADAKYRTTEAEAFDLLYGPDPE